MNLDATNALILSSSDSAGRERVSIRGIQKEEMVDMIFAGFREAIGELGFTQWSPCNKIISILFYFAHKMSSHL